MPKPSRPLPLGTRFGHLTVLESNGHTLPVTIAGRIVQRRAVHVICDCGNERLILAAKLLDGAMVCSKGCDLRVTAKVKLEPLQRFGRLRVFIPYARIKKKDGKGPLAALCICDCRSSMVAVPFSDLLSGKTQSCGCLKRELASERFRRLNTTHGHTVGGKVSGTYSSFRGMHDRCLNPNSKDYPLWGGMGVKICDRWLQNFPNFLADKGERPEGTSIDRYPDPWGDYTNENTRWGTAGDQGNNLRTNRIVEYQGVSMTLTQAARASGVSRYTLADRIDRGDPPETWYKLPLLQTITYNGVAMSFNQAAELSGVPAPTLRYRIRTVCHPDDLFTPPDRGRTLRSI